MTRLVSSVLSQSRYNITLPVYQHVANSPQEHSSATRKTLFFDLQQQHNAGTDRRPLHLKMDMPVRWSSTYQMLERAESLRPASQVRHPNYIKHSCPICRQSPISSMRSFDSKQMLNAVTNYSPSCLTIQNGSESVSV